MSIRKVLAPLVGGPNDWATLLATITISMDFKAHLEDCFVRPNPENAVPYLGMQVGNLKEIRKEYRHRAEVTGKKLAAKSHRQFNAVCKKNGIAISKGPGGEFEIGAHWVEIVGRATREVPEAAKLCDLTVFAGTYADYNRLFPNVLECTLLGSGRPRVRCWGSTRKARSR